MAKQRMAGEELNKETPEAKEAKGSVVKAAAEQDQNYAARERIGNDPERLAERIGGIDRDAYDFDGFTDKQINMAMRGGTFGDEDYARLTGKPLDGGDNNTTPVEPPDDAETPLPTPEASPVPDKPGPDPTPDTKPYPMPVINPDPFPRPPGIPGKPVVPGGFQVGGDLYQNIGKTGDTNTTIGNGNTINGTVGGDYSLTLGRNRAGNGYY